MKLNKTRLGKHTENNLYIHLRQLSRCTGLKSCLLKKALIGLDFRLLDIISIKSALQFSKLFEMLQVKKINFSHNCLFGLAGCLDLEAVHCFVAGDWYTKYYSCRCARLLLLCKDHFPKRLVSLLHPFIMFSVTQSQLLLSIPVFLPPLQSQAALASLFSLLHSVPRSTIPVRRHFSYLSKKSSQVSGWCSELCPRREARLQI